MNRIREKATESEAIVRSITKDIQRLDHAKKNLALSMTTLKRLQMLGVMRVALTLAGTDYHRSERTGAARHLCERTTVSSN
jgi:hypothetical protein